LLRQLRGLPRALESPRPYNEAKRRAFRDQAGKPPKDRRRLACERMTLSGSPAIADAYHFDVCLSGVIEIPRLQVK
jgi:hypothetical protein